MNIFECVRLMPETNVSYNAYRHLQFELIIILEVYDKLIFIF